MLQALRSRAGLVFVSLVGCGTLLLTIEKAADWGILQHLALVLYSGALALIGLKVLAGLRTQHLERLKRHREVRGLERMLARTGPEAERERSAFEAQSATGAISDAFQPDPESQDPLEQVGTSSVAAGVVDEAGPRARTAELVAGFIESRVVGTGAEFNEYPTAPGHKESIVAAARERGLEVVRSGDLIHFLLDGEPVGGMSRLTTSLASYFATQICASKHATRVVLERHGLPMARGATFAADGVSEGLAYLFRLGRDAVIKPSGGRAGRGISTGISNEEEFRQAWTKAKEATSRRDRIVVEEQISGLDIRAFVVEDQVVAAASRVPAYVIGDGVSSITQLLAIKAERRSLNDYHGRTPIVVDHHYLRKMGMSGDSVPAEGAVVLLNNVGNIHQGGESVDVTSSMHPELKRIAVEAVRVVPGLRVAGVDLMVNAPQDPAGAIILELNANANLSIHHYPAYGQPNDVAAAIIDRMVHRAQGRHPVQDGPAPVVT
ncbi:hypothetical protein [Pseudactinotalea sp. Z1748]|uniref:hypothetical protein n=1 Tax=Pseudactinotalea sp. Z1748 TaxID=3413027 RepID=UPI003C7C0E45